MFLLFLNLANTAKCSTYSLSPSFFILYFLLSEACVKPDAKETRVTAGNVE